jgi:hypothetical protein
MTRSIIAICTAILAATTLLASTAQAGMRVHLGFGGLPPYLTNYNKEAAYETRKRAQKRTYRAARRHETAPAKVTKKSAPAIAKVEDKVEEKAETAAISENSSISVAQADAKQATAAEPVKTAAATPSEPQAARSIDCKKFFATVGMTLTVPCE